jgi:hypothetical protein
MAATVVALSSGAMILLTLAYTMVVDVATGGGKGADQALAYEPIPDKPQASPSPVATRTRTRAARA